MAQITQEMLLPFWLTVVCFGVLTWLEHRVPATSWLKPFASPLLGSVVVLSLLLKGLHMPYVEYFKGVRFIHFMLGPVTVLLAVPLYGQSRLIWQRRWALLGAVGVGCVVALLSVTTMAWLWHCSRAALMGSLPKSVTLPIALALSEAHGGNVGLTATTVVISGIAGAVLLPPVLRALRLHAPQAHALALGTASHGAGVARAFQLYPESGAFASLAVGLHALLLTFILPSYLTLLQWLELLP